MRFAVAFILLALLSACATVQPQSYRTVTTFTGQTVRVADPAPAPSVSQPRVTGGVGGDAVGQSGWLNILLGGNCYITPSVSNYGGSTHENVTFQCHGGQ